MEGITRGGKVCLGLAAAVAFFAVVISTRNGITVSADSVAYLTSARSFAAGEGLSYSVGGVDPQPLTHFPPALPVVLGALKFVGLDVLRAAQLLNALCFGATVAVAGLLIYRQTEDTWLSVAGSAAVVGALPMLTVHTALWTEPMFILLTLLGILLLELYLAGGNWAMLMASASAMALATLTRWTGVPFIAAGVVAVFLLRPGGVGQRFTRGGLYGAIGCIPGALWMLRSMLVGGSAANRSFAFHPVTMYQIREGVWTVCGWLFPDVVFEFVRMRYILLATVAAMAGAAYILWRRWKGEGMPPVGRLADRTPIVHALAVAAYVPFLILSLSAFDASTPLDDRILSPLFVPLLVIVLWGFTVVLSAAGERTWRTRVLAAMGGLLLVLFIPRGVAWGVDHGRDSNGYLSKEWTESETLRQVRARPDARPVYSNDPRPIYLHLRRQAETVPARYSATARIPNEQFDQELRRMANHLTPEGLVVYFDRSSQTFPSLPPEDYLAERLRLKLVVDCADGAIYQSAVAAEVATSGEGVPQN
jgi:hypothetical protein